MSDDLYALKITGSSGSYEVAQAFEVDDGEFELEDDFLPGSGKTVLAGTGALVPGFQVRVIEVESYGTEEKVYEIVPWPVFLGNQPADFYLFREISEIKTGTDGDDDFKGLRDNEDYCIGRKGSDNFDLYGIRGRSSGSFFDHIVGGEDGDTGVLGAKKSYYDDRRSGRRETFLYCEDFQLDDRVVFLKASVKISRYELVEVNEFFARKLQLAGVVGVDQILVAKNDKKDMLACFDLEDESIRMTVAEALG